MVETKSHKNHDRRKLLSIYSMPLPRRLVRMISRALLGEVFCFRNALTQHPNVAILIQSNFLNMRETWPGSLEFRAIRASKESNPDCQEGRASPAEHSVTHALGAVQQGSKNDCVTRVVAAQADRNNSNCGSQNHNSTANTQSQWEIISSSFVSSITGHVSPVWWQS